MKPIRTERLILRQWRDDDRALFHKINSDDRVMEFFPYRRDRKASDELLDEIITEIASLGYGLAAVEIEQTGECAGFAGIGATDSPAGLAAESIEIGWRLAPEHWGKGYATEAARAWLRFGFEEAGMDEIFAVAVSSNRRSVAVMERLGMTWRGNFQDTTVPDTHPELLEAVLYGIHRDDRRRGG